MRTLSIFIAIITMTAISVKAQNSQAVMIETKSNHTFTQTVDKLTAAILEKGWKVTVTHDLQETMKKNGKEVLPVKVIELCNPALAYQILSNDAIRDVSSMLPCRISVYEKADGKTYVSRMNIPAFAGMIGGDAAKTMNEAFVNAEAIIKTVE